MNRDCSVEFVTGLVGENGNLYVVLEIGSLAGASSYEHTIDTGIRICSSAPTFTVGRALECIEIWEQATASLSWLYPLNSRDTIEVVISEEYNYKETAARVIGVETKQDVKSYILEYVTVAAEQKHHVTETAFNMGGVEHKGNRWKIADVIESYH